MYSIDCMAGLVGECTVSSLCDTLIMRALGLPW